MIVFFKCGENVRNAHAHGAQLVRVHGHFILFEFSAEAVYFCNTRCAIELARNDPVLHRAQVFGIVLFFAAFFGVDDVLIHFAQARAHRGHFRCTYACRYLVYCFFEPLVDQLTGKIDIYFFFENDGDHRQAKA